MARAVVKDPNSDAWLVILTKGRVAKIDEADAEWVGQWDWCLLKPTIAGRGNKYRTSAGEKRMQHHRLDVEILGRVGQAVAADETADQLDGDGLNCRRANLFVRPRVRPPVRVEDYWEVELCSGDKTQISDEDIEWVSQWNWGIHTTGYALRTANVRLHREIFDRIDPELLKGKEVDHINGVRLDNRRSNLRIVTRQQNRLNLPQYKNNKSGHAGVRLIEKTGRWRAGINAGRRRIHIGVYETFEEAVAAREAAERDQFDALRRES